jgi:hypothetical protein
MPASEGAPDDRPIGNLRWPGSGDGDPFTTPRIDLLAVGIGAAVAVLLGVLLPANPLLAPFAGLVAGGFALAVGRARERFAAGRRDG